MAVDLGPFIPHLLSALLMAGLAAWILYLDFNKSAHRVFALFLGFRAIALVVGVLRSTTDDPAYFQALAPYFIIPIVPTLIAFVSHYPRRRGPFGTSLPAQLSLVGLVLALEAVYLLDHNTFGTLRPPGCMGLASGGPYCYVAYGPIFLLSALVLPAMGFAALVFARDYARMPPGTARYSMFLVATGFTLNALFDGASALLRLASQLREGIPYPWLPWGWSLPILHSLTIVPACVAVLVVARHRAQVGAGEERTLNNAFLIAATLPVLSAVAISLINTEDLFQGGTIGPLVAGFWRLSLPILATYALLRYQLFDIDVKVRAVIKSSSLAFAFTIFFFAIGELAENVVQARQGQTVALGAAAFLTLVLKPVEDRIGERWARRALPHAKPMKDLSRTQKIQVFREQMELALQDGTLSDREREMLVRLQERLGITDPIPLK